MERAAIHFFTLKELKAREIDTELESVHGPEALTLSTVKKWLRRFHQGRTDPFDDLTSGTPLRNDLVGAIGSMLEERPFSSFKVLCRQFRIGK
jgi:transposase